MIIVCDCGSTKGDWMVVPEDGKRFIVSTRGFNPFYHDTDEIRSALEVELKPHVTETKVKKVFFYGAGCSDNFRCDIVKKALIDIFPNADVEVYHDLLASARATCGNNPGIACILGTGSNTCLYDGNDITDNVTNLGFIMGDEGSGAWLGRELVKSYYYREMPAEIKSDFEARFIKESYRDIMNKVYEGSPNVYLATFAKYIAEHKDHLFIQKIVMRSFEELIDRHVRKYDGHNKLPINFVGSIADVFQDTLKVVLAERNLKLGRIVRKPIDPLVDYHLEMLNV